jgi:uncharacterized membrane protein
MNHDLNQTDRFRASLRHEIPLWVEQGIVTEENAQRLSALYRLDQLRQESSRLLAAVLFTLGGLLLGGGFISFVAANWERIPVPAKVVLLFVTLIAFHATGWFLWRRRGWTRLGHALVFAGCLVFGANIGLMAQIFHVSGQWYGAFGAWALGSLVVAWAAQSWITGALVMVTSLLWSSGLTFDQSPKLLAAYPIALGAALIPLAWQTRSRALYVLTLAGITLALCVLAVEYGNSGRHLLLALTAGGLLAWAAGEAHRVTGIRKEFGNPAAGLGIATLATGAYFWSFQAIWKGSTARPVKSFIFLVPITAVIVTGLVLLVKVWRQSADMSSRRSLAGGILVAALILSGCAFVTGAEIFLPTLGANVAALCLAAAAIGAGIIDERRIAFWLGSLYVALLIISRFLEYDTSLLLKSLAFIVCGAMVIMAGVAYEGFLRRREAQQ